MRSTIVFAVGVAGLLAGGCASSTKSDPAEPAPSQPAWVGSLQPTQQRAGGLVVTGQTRAFGAVRITPAEGRLRRMHVHLVVALPVTSNTQYRWAVLPDRCGTGQLPLIGYEQFPLIDLSTNGRGELDVDLPLELEANSSYHVNVYSGGQQLDNVVTCANLKFEPPR